MAFNKGISLSIAASWVLKSCIAKRKLRDGSRLGAVQTLIVHDMDTCGLANGTMYRFKLERTLMDVEE